jgi:hypothetical protein
VEENTNKVYAERNSSALTDPLLAITSAPAEPGASLFVINLCASIAPIQAAGKTIPGFESFKLYQVARVEDGRTRHRLRLGFFTSEADAEGVLAQVRDNYPTAFVACLSDDDRRFARGYLPTRDSGTTRARPVVVTTTPETPVATAPVATPPAPQKKDAPKAAATQPAPRTATPSNTTSASAATSTTKAEARTSAPAKATTPAKAAAPAAPADEIEISWEPPALQGNSQADTRTAAKTIAPALKTEPVIKARAPEPPAAKARVAAEPKKPAIELTLEPEPVAAPAAPKAARNDASQPFHVGKGVEIPTTALSLETPSTQPTVAATANPTPPKQASAPAPKQSAARPSQPAQPTNKTAPAVPPKAPAPAPAARGPELDSTQTIRALTSAEMDDEEKWFSIQLVVSEQPVNLDAMPHLDIFEAYRVYSVANAGSGKIVYSLRLGFFREEVSAAAVSGYLKTFFPSPSVMRVSTAEQLRFKDAPTPKATAEAAARNEARVIELSQARDRKPAIPTVTMEVATPGDRSPTGTFKTGASGAYKVDASGKHKALRSAAKTSSPATRRSAPLGRSSATGKHKALQPKKSLQEQLLDEAREVQLSESAIRKLPKNDSLLSRLVGKLTK